LCDTNQDKDFSNKDKDLTVKNQDKDYKSVLEDSLQTRTDMSVYRPDTVHPPYQQYQNTEGKNRTK